MPSIMWALFAFTAVCGTTLAYPVGVATLDTRELEDVHQTRTSQVETLSSSEEDETIATELKTTEPTDVLDVAKLPESSEEAAEAHEVQPSGDEITGDSVATSSPPPSHADSKEEEEEELSKEVSES